MTELFAEKRQDGMVEFGYATDDDEMVFIERTFEDASNKIWKIRKILEDLQYFIEKGIDNQEMI